MSCHLLIVQPRGLHIQPGMTFIFERMASFSGLSFLNGPPLAPFPLISGLFKQNLHFLQQIDMKKCHSSILCRDSNPQPLEHESFPVINRPGHRPLFRIILPRHGAIEWGSLTNCRGRGQVQCDQKKSPNVYKIAQK